MATVKEAHEALTKLIASGHGETELIFSDCRSGDTGSVNIYAETETIEEPETMGRLCEEPIGYTYVPVYCDH